MTQTIAFDALTWLAVFATLFGYILVSRKIIDGYSWSFQITTLIARLSFLCVNLIRKTYPFALMDFVFLIICCTTLYQLHKESKKIPALQV
jgi:hypothetical protein